MDGVFQPIRIRYDGLDADRHQLELTSLGESLVGASKLLSVAGHFALTGKYVKKTPALSVRVLAQPPQAKCYEIIGILYTLTGALPLAPEAATKLVQHIVTYILAKFGGRKDLAERAMELAETAIREMGTTARAHAEVTKAAIDLLAQGQHHAARQLVAPVGLTCSTLRVGSPELETLEVDKPIRDAICAPEPVDITDEMTYQVFISELDMQKRTCKVSLLQDNDPEVRYPGEITDPVILTANNPYSLAMAQKQWMSVRGKAQMKNGQFDKLYISNTAA